MPGTDFSHEMLVSDRHITSVLVMVKVMVMYLICLALCVQDLNRLAALVRGELTKLARGVLCALITIDVHARDIISEMVVNKVCHVLCSS